METFFGLTLESFGYVHLWHAVAAYAELAISLLTFYVLGAKYLNRFFGRNIVSAGSPILK